VQGKLRNEYLIVQIDTECAESHHQMKIKIDSNLEYTTEDDGSDPVIFVPDVDLHKLNDDSIISSF
jgi:hypothetical protein